MEILWIIAVSIALGMDAFSFSLALGMIGIENRTAARLVGIVAVFHVIMPLTGLWVGQKLGLLFGNIAVGIGAVILLWLGGKMVLGALRGGEKTNIPNLNGFGIYALAFSVSLDALSVGFSLGTFVSAILPATLVMGFTAGTMTGLGIILGRKMGTWLGGKAQALGGIILFLIGIRMAYSIFF
ncbi:manganese efflux pump MntP family protein [Dehalobacter sp. DCM]|uniref:manganese efflux pump MntP n=1 Tax=Dehalobacter sp. DCM TaxID=2907827 RepID=UPI003081FD76|nr:manganese efflux pump MntP family protein [Dehalobacter sp. DCM]